MTPEAAIKYVFRTRPFLAKGNPSVALLFAFTSTAFNTVNGQRRLAERPRDLEDCLPHPVIKAPYANEANPEPEFRERVATNARAIDFQFARLSKDIDEMAEHSTFDTVLEPFPADFVFNEWTSHAWMADESLDPLWAEARLKLLRVLANHEYSTERCKDLSSWCINYQAMLSFQARNALGLPFPGPCANGRPLPFDHRKVSLKIANTLLELGAPCEVDYDRRELTSALNDLTVTLRDLPCEAFVHLDLRAFPNHNPVLRVPLRKLAFDLVDPARP